MNILVLGASGFVGRHLINELREIPNVTITATVHENSLEDSLGLNSIRLDLDSINVDFLQKGNFDFIFHLARISGGRYGNISRWYAGIKAKGINEKLLGCIEQLSNKPKLIYLSGSLMYGNCGKRVVPETANPNPVGYAKYYYQAEEPFLKSILRGKNVIMLRAPWVIGNGSWFQFLYKKPVLETGELPMYGDSGRVMSLITVEDCAALLIYYAMNAQPGIYNMYSHQMIYADFLELIRKSSKRVVDISPSKRLDRTTINSICTEIILGTNYPDLLNAYKLKNPLLDNYVERLMHS